jgi:hypothetical protein
VKTEAQRPDLFYGTTDGARPWRSRRANLGVVPRLNLTLDDDTFQQLERHRKRARAGRAALAREILREGLARRDAAERRRRLAADYAAGRKDVRASLADLESSQVELLSDEEDA